VKYAAATRAIIRISAVDGSLAFEVEDDGRGFAPESASLGTGLQGIADRLTALDGTVEIRSSPGEGTTVAGRVPLPHGVSA
jgi:signal transduction histidine kinase